MVEHHPRAAETEETPVGAVSTTHTAATEEKDDDDDDDDDKKDGNTRTAAQQKKMIAMMFATPPERQQTDMDGNVLTKEATLLKNVRSGPLPNLAGARFPQGGCLSDGSRETPHPSAGGLECAIAGGEGWGSPHSQ